MLWQTLGACAAIVLTAILLPDAPAPIFMLSAFFGAMGAAWLNARLRYGRGVIVRPSRKID